MLNVNKLSKKIVETCHHLGSSAGTCECDAALNHANAEVKGEKVTQKVKTAK